VVIMARVITVNDVLDGHVALDIECLDRIYLNAYVPIPQEIMRWPVPRPSAAASRAGVQMQGFHPAVCGLPSAREWPKGHCAGLCVNSEAETRSSCPARRTSVSTPAVRTRS